jgi:aspartate-semialdehyde dehydrogenase
MAGKILRSAVVGASTLLGKELAEELNGSATGVWDLTLLDAGLLDAGETGGTITAAGDEAIVIQPLSADSFVGMDVVFFAGEGSTALAFWKAAHAAGASIVDLTGALEAVPQVLVCSPLVEGSARPDLATVAVVSAHPVAVMLSLVRKRLSPLGVTRMAATVLQPASEFGSAGVEEVHQQTVSLLSFKPLKKDIYDAQVAFNVVASFGEAAKANLETVRERIDRHAQILTGETDPIALQLLQVPVFHGYTASVFLEMSSAFSEEALRAALAGEVLQLMEEGTASNENVAGQSDVLLNVKAASSKEGSGFWLWMATDNLRFAARNAVASALEMVQLRPAGGVQ